MRFAARTTRFTFYAAVFLAAFFESKKHATGLLGFPFRRHVFKQPDEPAAVGLMVLEPLDEPAPSKPKVLEVVHPVQCGITLKRPCSDTENLSHIDEDVSSTRDGHTAGLVSDPPATPDHHLASNRCAEPFFRERPTKEGIFSQPKYRFDNSMPNRLLEQTF